MSPINDRQSVKEHFDHIAAEYDYWKRKNAYYYAQVTAFVQRQVRPGSRVLEVGCGTGEILAATKPRRGVGVDISPAMVRIAQQKFPQYTFVASPIETFSAPEKFDFIIMVDVVDHVYDVVSVLENLYQFCHPTTRIILTTINPWWDPILSVMEKFKAKMPEGPHNFIEKRSLLKMVEAVDFTANYSGYLLLFPKYIPILSFLANSFGTRCYGLNKLSAVQYMVLQPLPQNTVDLKLGCSVIIPCYNEEGNIEEAVRRIPSMGRYTEIIVVNDGSRDRTAERVRALQKDRPQVKLVDYAPNQGKGYAVQKGFEAATQDVLMILDADMSVPPEELPRFFHLLNKGKCQFANGTRLVYPQECEAMRFANLLGNKLFGLLMTFITGQHLSDTLCGTKAFYRLDYPYIKMGADKWGDFDLLFGAAKLGNKILEVPVHYMARKSGESKMKAFRHGCHLLKACARGFKELVFYPTHTPSS